MIDILVFGAHPDDIEFGCGAFLAQAAAEQKKILMVDLTHGEKGTHGTPAERLEESAHSAALIGAERICLNFKDCEIFDTVENQLKVIELLQERKPKLILSPYWQGTQTHPDHTACGLIVKHASKQLNLENPLIFYIFPNFDQADLLIDVTDQVNQWKKMMACHQSQLRTNAYIEWNLKLASRWGLLIGKPYAQALIL